jgi:biopolymer transport protein ExbD
MQPSLAFRHPVLRWLAFIFAAVVAVSACAERPIERVVITLSISRTGTYELQGKTVAESELKYEFKALQSSPGAAELHIAADPMAAYQAVGIAVKAAQDAGIGSIAFVTSGPRK